MEVSEAIVAKLRERAERHAELTDLISQPEIASDPKRFTQLLQERAQLEASARLWTAFEKLRDRGEQARELLDEAGDDAETREMASEELAEVERERAEVWEQIKTALVQDEDAHRSKMIVEIRAGTGGDEATLFCADLFRMYSKFCELHRWKVELLDASPSEVGGFKELTFAIQGAGSWSALRFESGGHRVQRVPQTESQGRIHTSAATVAVLPEAEEAEVELLDKDLRIDTMRSSGPGGQSVNKTSSAVRITHLPTNTVVTCQDEKSQHKNKAKALRILRTRLLDAERERVHAERAAERKSQVGSGDRNARVRTYNYPQNRVTDHRLGENYSLEQIIAGKLDALVAGLEAQDREQRIAEL